MAWIPAGAAVADTTNKTAKRCALLLPQSEIFFLDSDFVETIAARATKTVPRPKWVFFILVPSQLSVCEKRQVDKLLDKVKTQNEN